MFTRKQFVLVGNFKINNNSNRTHSYYKNLITLNGGKCVLNCSKNTDFVLVSQDITNKIRNNQQVQCAKKT
jgi:NAD-dependent DNA ligase